MPPALLSIDPQASPRQRRFDQQVADILNHLIRTGQITLGPGGPDSCCGGYTPGAVPFAGADGVLTEDPTNFFWDRTDVDPDNWFLLLPPTLHINNTFPVGGRPLRVTTAGVVTATSINLAATSDVGSSILPLPHGGTGVVAGTPGDPAALNGFGHAWVAWYDDVDDLRYGILMSDMVAGATVYSHPFGSGGGCESFGAGAGRSAATGANNSVFGSSAGAAITSGAGNTLVGHNAGTLLTTGSNNTVVGADNASAVAVTGNTNTFVGSLTGVGSGAAISGSNNVAVGAALLSVTSGGANLAVGTNSIRTCSTGNSNVGVGTSALYNLSTASGNTAIGPSSGYSVTTGASNVTIGSNCGTVISTGNFNTILGAAANAAAGATAEAVAIGHEAVAASNEAVVGPHVNSLSLSVLSSSGANRTRGSVVAANVDNTDATRKYRLTFGAFDTAFREAVRMEGSGSAALISFFGASAVAQQSGDVAAALVNLGLLSTASGSARVLFDHFADQGNGTTVETDLYSDTLAAGQFSANGQKVRAEYGGVFVSSATATRQVKVYFGGTAVFDSGALTLSLSAAWVVYATFVRVSSSVVRYGISMTTEGAALAAYTAVGELTGLTLANTQVVKITGQAAGVGAASSDIVAKLGTVSFAPAA